MKLCNSLPVVLLLFHFLCASVFAEELAQTQTKPGEEPQTGATVTYEIIQKGTYSGIKEPMQQVIKNKKEWEDLWKKHVSMLVPQPLVPAIDFEASVIAVIASGEKNTSGYQILLKSVETTESGVTIRFHRTTPPPNSLTLQVLSQPYVMIRVDKSSGQVQIVEE